jgi:hypothetical protein
MTTAIVITLVSAITLYLLWYQFILMPYRVNEAQKNAIIKEIADNKIQLEASIKASNISLTNQAKLHLNYLLFRNDYAMNDIVADGSIMGIHMIDAKRIDGVITVDVYLSRPGLLIGRKGATINKVTEELTEQFGAECIVNIKELDPFKIDYSVLTHIDDVADLDPDE